MSGKTQLPIQSPPLQAIEVQQLDNFDIKLSVLRLDLVHPTVGGNKWFKLKHNLEYIQQQGISQVLSFGGAWSNHLLALAAAGKHFGFKTYGVIRGEQIDPPTPVLQRLKAFGMKLIPVSRQQYRDKEDPVFLQSLIEELGDFYCLPEGGSNALAIEGCKEITRNLEWQRGSCDRVIAAACGTGGMLSGLILGCESDTSLNEKPSVMGISVLKASGYLSAEVDKWLIQFDSNNSVSWRVAENYHCGGYAKTTAELREFLECLASNVEFPIEPVYTGKLAWGIWGEIQAGRILPGSEVIAIHSGGIL